MPYPNEFAARIHEPGKYKEMRRESNKFGQGIDVIFGITEEGKAEVQAIRFNKKKFSSEEVHAWLKKHNYSPIKVEAPSQSEDSLQEATLYDKMGTIQVDVDQVDYFPVSIKGMETTPEGFMKTIAPVAKVGVYTYVLADGTIRKDLVDEETLFNVDSMKTLELKPFTNDHPDNLLDPETVKKHAVGSTGEKVYKDENHLMSSLVVMDSSAIRDIKNGKRQLSPGYKTNLIFSPGEYNGEHYDVIQRNRRYNHLALCAKARGGDSLSIKMEDGESYTNNNLNLNVKGDFMKFTINGIDYDTAPEVVKHIDSLLAKVTQSDQVIGTQKDNYEKLNKTFTELQASFDALKVDMPKLIDLAVKERVKLEKIASTITDSADLADITKLSNKELKVNIVKAKLPTLDLTNKDESYINALIDSIDAQSASSSVKAQIDTMTRPVEKSKVFGCNSSVERDNYITNLKDSWKKDPRTGK